MYKSVIGTSSRGSSDNATLFADVADRAGTNGQTGVEDRLMRDKQNRFAEKVQSLNACRLQEKVFPVCSEFLMVEALSAEDENRPFVDAYRALVEIVKEDLSAVAVSEPNAVKERQFASDYLIEDPKSVKAVRMNKRILDGSRRFLEQS